MKHCFEFLSFALCIFILSACGSSSNTSSEDRGSITFNIELQDAPTTASDILVQSKSEAIHDPILRASSIDCTGSGINTIQAIVYNSSNNQIASESWNCSAHAGKISVTASSGLKVIIMGKDSSGNIKYRGEKSDITVTGGQTTDVGVITMINISSTSDTTSPTNTSNNFINSGASSTTSTSVTLSLSATDNVGVTGYYASETSTTPSASATGWTSVTSTTSYSGSVSFTLSSGSGTKTVYVWFKDAAGNVSAVASNSITLSTSTGGTVLEIEPNNYSWDAQLITADTDYLGENSSGCTCIDEDWFKITTTGTLMTVSLTHLSQNANASDFTVYLYYYDGSGYTSVGYFVANDGVNNSKTIGIISGRTYHIRVYVFSQGYQYKLRVSFS